MIVGNFFDGDDDESSPGSSTMGNIRRSAPSFALAIGLQSLSAEVESWIERPHFVRNVQLILCNQNQPVGYLAESQLCVDIIDHFRDVPWHKQ